MLVITLENYEIVRIDAEDLAYQVDADGDLQVEIGDACIAYYPTGEWRHFVSMKAGDTKTTVGTEATYKIISASEE